MLNRPIDHAELAQHFHELVEVYDVARGDVVEVEDAHYRRLGSGTTMVHSDGNTYEHFSWSIFAAELTGLPDPKFLLHWTDNVANDWGEWFPTSMEAFNRLGALNWAVYAESPLGVLREDV